MREVRVRRSGPVGRTEGVRGPRSKRVGDIRRV